MRMPVDAGVGGPASVESSAMIGEGIAAAVVVVVVEFPPPDSNATPPTASAISAMLVRMNVIGPERFVDS